MNQSKNYIILTRKGNNMLNLEENNKKLESLKNRILKLGESL